MFKGTRERGYSLGASVVVSLAELWPTLQKNESVLITTPSLGGCSGEISIAVTEGVN